MTRRSLAALALAGAVFSCAPAFADARFFTDDRAQLAQGGDARDVTRAARCPPPLRRCKRSGSGGNVRADIGALIEQQARAQGVPVAIARALVRVESGFNPRLVGRAGEIGLTQIKLATARGLGFSGSRAALFDPATNLTWGLRHARRALDRGSIGFHQAGLHARRASRMYVARINAAMGN